MRRGFTLLEVMVSMPAIEENGFSSGVATALAMVSGFARGRLAETESVGSSTVGRSLTGSCWNAKNPKPSTASMTRVVITGRRMQRPGRFMAGARFWPTQGRGSVP